MNFGCDENMKNKNHQTCFGIKLLLLPLRVKMIYVHLVSINTKEFILIIVHLSLSLLNLKLLFLPCLFKWRNCILP